MEEAFAQCLLERIDEQLRAGSRRSMATRAEFLDALLDLRLLASDLISLGHLDMACDGSEHHRSSPRWRMRSRTG
jgi:hypothetical protein